MKRFFAPVLLAPMLLAIAACTPQTATPGPEATVTAIYDTLVKSKGDKPTPMEAIPMSDDLKALVDKAVKTTPDEPVFDGDLAGNCQDCTGFADLKIGPPPGNPVTPAGHALVVANFKIFQGEAKSVNWDMLQTPKGWVVDNIISDGFNLRTIGNEVIATPPAPPPPPEPANPAEAAAQCITYLTLHENGPGAPKLAADEKAKVTAASAAYRKVAEAAYKPDELAQLLASSVAVEDDRKPEELAQLANDCIAKAPK